MKIRFNQKAAGIFLLLIAMLLAGAVVSYRATTGIEESDRLVTHTYEVMAALDAMIATVQRAQTTATDFVSTGKGEYLQLYRGAIAQIGPEVEAIRTLTADNPGQQRELVTLEARSNQLRAFLNNAVDYRLHGIFSQPTGEQMREVTEELRAMKAREMDLLAQRSQGAARNLATTRLGLVVGAAVNCLLLVLGAYMAIRDQQRKLAIRESRVRLASIVDFSEDAILSKKLDGTITSWNAGAEHLYGWMAEEMIGRSIYEIVPADRREELRSILDRLAEGQRIEHLETVRIRRDGTKVEVELTVSPLKDEHGKIVEASAITRDITRRKQLEGSLHQLSSRILNAQDEERRRIARELHDTTVQKLALLSMNLAQLKNVGGTDRAQATLQSSQTLTTECVQELRTLSYVLHPPMLDELGLASALKIYVEGLAQRSGIQIDTDIDPDWRRLGPDVEMALFRVSQEGLANVLRHSGSKTAKISLSNHGEVVMKIADQGKGMANPTQIFDGEVTVGVGIPGMNERLRQIGGSLTIESGEDGTTVTARIPGNQAAHA